MPASDHRSSQRGGLRVPKQIDHGRFDNIQDRRNTACTGSAQCRRLRPTNPRYINIEHLNRHTCGRSPHAIPVTPASARIAIWLVLRPISKCPLAHWTDMATRGLKAAAPTAGGATRTPRNSTHRTVLAWLAIQANCVIGLSECWLVLACLARLAILMTLCAMLLTIRASCATEASRLR